MSASLMRFAVNGAPIIGAPINAHIADRCTGNQCPLHNPSAHHMAQWPIVIRASALAERVCVHQTGHPDPDSLRFMTRETGETHWALHGCCGCCRAPELAPA
jgi:hypothetical protein